MRRLRMWRVGVFMAGCVTLACAVGPGEAAAGDVAVIVNKTNAVEEVSASDLAKLLRQDRLYWADGQRVYLVLREMGTAEQQVLLKTIYKTDEAGLKKFWLGKLYRGEISMLPKILGSSEAVKRFVSQAPNAIGYIDASFLDDTVKILRIDRKRPGDSGYLLVSP